MEDGWAAGRHRARVSGDRDKGVRDRTGEGE